MYATLIRFSVVEWHEKEGGSDSGVDYLRETVSLLAHPGVAKMSQIWKRLLYDEKMYPVHKQTLKTTNNLLLFL